MIQLFPKIQAAFEAKKILFTKNNLQAIAFVDVYMGQPLNPEDFEFVLPAVFIDYRIDWEIEKIYVDAHVVTELLEESASVFTKKTKGIQYLKTLSLCRHIMNGLFTSYIDKLKPASERPETTEYYHYHIVSFSANIRDYIDNNVIPPRFVDTEITATIENGTLKQKSKAIDQSDIEVFSKKMLSAM